MKKNLPQFLTLATLIFSVLGLLDLVYLTILHFKNIIPPCTITQNCETVLTSQYSVILGIPISLLGALSFFAVFITGIFYFETKKRYVLSILSLIAFLNLLISLFFLGIQMFIIKSYCQYCLLVDLSAILIFVFTITLKKTSKTLSF